MQVEKTSNYVRGYIFEREIRKRVEKVGLIVIRAAGSKPIDLVAIRPDVAQTYVAIIECKTDHYNYDAAKMKDYVVSLRSKYSLDSYFVLRDAGGIAWAVAITDTARFRAVQGLFEKALGVRYIVVGMN